MEDNEWKRQRMEEEEHIERDGNASSGLPCGRCDFLDAVLKIGQVMSVRSRPT